ncbi:alpha/beta hydrolase [Microbacterium sp. zg.Y625]|uniref:alpha/beta fold hydrolase n=1 Tax=Microbacterium jiangjiandongii TaxID=3049071 RepID=UPI00214BB6E3|nr:MULTISPECIES: alpha/beta fold hydrolase [unclassified Microbacterium]MCR2792420.1 alpha/beta hydrolase [Microbacterium sp. zg.Y625]WIM26415.1 alpha/beta hydrolase [Microbacterium sp. zg-Y625]
MTKTPVVRGEWPPGIPYFRLGSGAPLVYLPGLSGSPHLPSGAGLWMQGRLLAPFARRRDVVWMHWSEGLVAPVTMAQIAAAPAAAIGPHLPAPLDVVGVSTGGSVALQLALDHPELVRRLVIVSAAHRLSDHGRQVQRDLAAAVHTGRTRRAGATMGAEVAASAAGSALFGAAGWLMGRSTFAHAGAELLAVIEAEDDFDVGDRLGQVAAPTLVIGAERDRFYTPQLFRETAARIPDGRSIVYPGVGHLGTTLHRRYHRDVLAFLTGR